MLGKLVVLSVLCCALVVSAMHHQKKLSEEDQFVSFVKKFNKKYSTAEMFARFKIFKQNLAFINEHNEKQFATGQASYKLGVNHLADLTNEEYRATRLGYKKTFANPEATYEFTGQDVDYDVPAAVDLRTKGQVNAVKDQGQCGSCWAFSATASLEATDFLQTKTLKSFSEQMCVDCVLNGACTCDLGGEMHDCMVQVQKQGGEMLESDYPYTATSDKVCKFQKAKATGKFGSYVNITQFNETALQIAAASQVISVAIDASSLQFQLYSSGVFDYSACASAPDQLDHGVAVVGYGHDATGGDYWIVRNSWGAWWGQSGYVWMSRNKNNQCGIASDASFVPAQ